MEKENSIEEKYVIFYYLFFSILYNIISKAIRILEWLKLFFL